MRSVLSVVMVVVLGVAFLARAQTTAPIAPKWHGYDEQADAQAVVRQSLVRARTEAKQVLVVFGANWCGDCRVLDQSIKEGRLKPLIEDRYVIAKVDVGRFDRNVDLAERYGVPLRKGVPAIAIVAADGRVLYATQDGELADARRMGEDGLLAFFGRF